MSEVELISKRTVAIATLSVVSIVTISLLHVALTTSMWREFAESVLDLYVTAAAVYLLVTDRL